MTAAGSKDRGRPLDEIDRAILAVLQADARAPLKALAAKVGRSRSAVQERLRRLERDGVITGYTLRLGRPAAAAPVRAYIFVTLEGPICRRVAPQLAGFPAIRQCDSLAGETDMLLLVELESLVALGQLRDHIAGLAGVLQVRTAPVLETQFARR